MFRRLLSLITYCALVGLFTALGSALLTRNCADVMPSRSHYDTIVVLSGSLGSKGKIGPDTALRTDAGIDLFERGIAPNLHMTGGVSENRVHVAAAIQMAERTAEAGVPLAAISVEDDSRSTLQNARNSVSMLEGQERIILVSDGYHLWRAWLSFAWAGHPPAGLCKSTSFRPDGAEMSARLVVREALALWFNVGRAAVWSGAELVGLTPQLGGSFLH
ncbi:YdcF family protein [Donghicola sp. XS_ASV15]|uniref:YdcF family protein n=1 Tax=Donghicola sp. XS_ASV15 TaxID=3241295 RepID=UPI00351420CE